MSFGTRSERSAFLGLAMTLGARGAVERVPPDRVVAPLQQDGVEPLAELEGLVERVRRRAQGDPAPRPRVDVVGRHLVHGDEAELVALDVQGAVVVVVAGRRVILFISRQKSMNFSSASESGSAA